MKRILFALTSISLIFILAACEVHFGKASYDVPWWVVAVPTIIFCLIVTLVAGKIISNTEYTCPKCGKTFYPVWWKGVFSVHMGSSRVLKCPHCSEKNFCRPTKRKL